MLSEGGACGLGFGPSVGRARSFAGSQHRGHDLAARPPVSLGGKGDNEPDSVQETHANVTVTGIPGAHQHEACGVDFAQPLTFDQHLTA